LENIWQIRSVSHTLSLSPLVHPKDIDTKRWSWASSIPNPHFLQQMVVKPQTSCFEEDLDISSHQVGVNGNKLCHEKKYYILNKCFLSGILLISVRTVDMESSYTIMNANHIWTLYFSILVFFIYNLFISLHFLEDISYQ
jgi:hypothetical protein